MSRQEGLHSDFSEISDKFEGGEFSGFLPFSDFKRWIEKGSYSSPK